MEESNSHGLEELLTRRLIKQVESEALGADLTPTLEIAVPRVDGGGEPGKEKLVGSPAGELPDDGSADGIDSTAAVSIANAAGVVPETSTAFAKVEKSLISLGFFTPSSKRIKDQKVKR